MNIEPPLILETASASATEALAARLARALPGGMLILLCGELGSGKTVFVRGLARGLDAGPEVAVTSPTYVLQHAYRGRSRTLYHLDVYRLAGGAAEFENAGLRECLDDPAAWVAVEWPERLGAFAWPEDRIAVEFEHAGPERRKLTLRAYGPAARSAVAALRTAEKQ